MNNLKCHCGYIAQTPHEEKMLEEWECARAIKPKHNGAHNVLIQCCSRDGTPPEYNPDEGDSFKENFLKKYQK